MSDTMTEYELRFKRFTIRLIEDGDRFFGMPDEEVWTRGEDFILCDQDEIIEIKSNAEITANDGLEILVYESTENHEL